MKTTKFLNLIGLVAVFALVSCGEDEETVEKKVYTDIYFIDSSDELIEKISLSAGNKLDTVKNIAEMSGLGIAYDKTHGKIYFSDFYDDATPNGKIWKMNLDGTGAEAIVDGITDPYGIALDVDGGKVYWTDDAGNISRANLDGTSQQVLYNVDGGGMRAIALDLTHKKMYFYDVMNNNLYQANFDGTSAEVILNGYYGYGLCVDEVNSKLYFDAQTDDETVAALYMCNLDGSNPTEIDNTGSRIYGIGIDNENSLVYWSARDMGEIYKANLNGTGKMTLATDLYSPRGMCLIY
jgi:DNA-binding beta-propeller fold protein YncE